MINISYFIFLLFFYIINSRSDWYELRPDTIYLSYFFVGILILSLAFNARGMLRRSALNFNEELTYYIKMGMFFYLLVLDSLRSNYENLHKVMFFFKSLTSLVFEKYILNSKDVLKFKRSKQYYYLLMFSDRCILFEKMVSRFLKQLFFRNVIHLTRRLVFLK